MEIKKTREQADAAYKILVTSMIQDDELYCGGITSAERIYGSQSLGIVPDSKIVNLEVALHKALKAFRK